jgi:hypothetical protein
LNPIINKNPWSNEEEWILFLSHKLKGNKWSEITLILEGRTDNSILLIFKFKSYQKSLEFFNEKANLRA